jgi:hypothetical protein
MNGVGGGTHISISCSPPLRTVLCPSVCLSVCLGSMLCVWGIGHTSISLCSWLGKNLPIVFTVAMSRQHFICSWLGRNLPIVFTVAMSRQHFICSWLGKNLPIVFTVAMSRQHFICRPRGKYMPQTIVFLHVFNWSSSVSKEKSKRRQKDVSM